MSRRAALAAGSFAALAVLAAACRPDVTAPADATATPRATAPVTTVVVSPPVGATDPAVTQSNLAQTVCRSGYTATVRPPVSFTNDLKRRQLAAPAYAADRNPRHYEEDHWIPLELGGAPRDQRNLWPEPRSHSARTDPVENRVHRDLCAGRLTLRAAQARIVELKTHLELG
jgi:hypothetical protein